ncbi:MAG: hypothetical protein IJL87_00935 [Clostridia bacterium]|nr:hypothetical protein [Clostridia bacterium]
MNNQTDVCPVCGKYTFCEDFDICPFCGWEDDGICEEGGANTLSLSDYKKRYEKYLKLIDNYTWEKHGYPEI